MLKIPEEYKIWFLKNIKRLIIPHIAWFGSITILTGDHGLKRSLCFILGARNIGGVYWYVPCLIFSMLVFIIIEKEVGGGKMTYLCILLLYLFSCIYIFLPFKERSYNITFSFGCMSLACTYIGIGYTVRKFGLLRYRNSRPVIGLIVLILLMTLILYKSGIYKYNMDMAGLKLGAPILNLVIPGGIMILLINTIPLLRGKVGFFLSELGRGSLCIMYVHKFFLNNIFEKVLGVEGFIWIVNVIITVALSYCVYKFISQNNIFRVLFNGGS